jgi:starch-binding outer membrane protein, SusD/RagB family
MKKYFFLVILIGFISCDKIFQEEYEDYIVIDTEQEKADMINGIYANLVKVYNQYYFEALRRSDDINMYWNYSFYKNGSGCGSKTTNVATPKYDNIYYRFYKIIISANSMLLQLSEEKDPGLIGELYMLRAYAYFNLARFFGNPYIVKDIDVNYLLERPSYTEVYEFIEEDMLKAIRFLPDTYSKARIPGETPHKGMAKALLAEIYLAWAGFPVNDKSKYNKAAQLAGEVIQKHEYYGFGLLDDFADLWKAENKHNKENVFGLFFNIADNETRNRISGAYIYYEEYLRNN